MAKEKSKPVADPSPSLTPGKLPTKSVKIGENALELLKIVAKADDRDASDLLTEIVILYARKRQGELLREIKATYESQAERLKALGVVLDEDQDSDSGEAKK